MLSCKTEGKCESRLQEFWESLGSHLWLRSQIVLLGFGFFVWCFFKYQPWGFSHGHQVELYQASNSDRRRKRPVCGWLFCRFWTFSTDNGSSAAEIKNTNTNKVKKKKSRQKTLWWTQMKNKCVLVRRPPWMLAWKENQKKYITNCQTERQTDSPAHKELQRSWLGKLNHRSPCPTLQQKFLQKTEWIQTTWHRPFSKWICKWISKSGKRQKSCRFSAVWRHHVKDPRQPLQPRPVWLSPMAAGLLNSLTSKKGIHVNSESAASLTKQSVPYDENSAVILVDAVVVPPCWNKTRLNDLLTGPGQNSTFFFTPADPHLPPHSPPPV